MKPLKFEGSSLDDLRHFPKDVRRQLGVQLDRLEHGLDPLDWKPMSTIGPGVREIRVRDGTGAFRVIYIAKLPDAIHVLHAFQKTTRTTAKSDIDLARRRLKDVKETI